jgi:hypothetical protein
LPLLEEAMRYLERGEFLEDEEGHWCKSLRQDARTDLACKKGARSGGKTGPHR